MKQDTVGATSCTRSGLPGGVGSQRLFCVAIRQIPEVVEKILWLRQHYHFGPAKISMYLTRYHRRCRLRPLPPLQEDVALQDRVHLEA